MAIIKAGILSKVSGKVAGVVGGTWKGKNYLRELVKPANPNTPAQRSQRGKMAFVVASARQLVGDVLNPFLNKFCKTMSGYNYYCRENIKRIGGTPLAFTQAPVLSFGTLPTGAIVADSVQNNSAVQFAAVPSVATGHTLKGIALIIRDNGDVLSKQVVNNPVAEADYAQLDPLEPGTYKVYGVAFFADFDANGILQQISASIATPLTTLEID